MRAALYLWRATAWRSWRTVLTVALIGGLFGAVALGAVAGARRTASAYGRYLAATKASDAFVNVPGMLPGMAATRPIKLIEALPGITASDAYIGLNANPVVAGRIRDSFLTNSLTGSFDGAYFTRDRMTVLAGRLPRLDATREIALSPGIARLFGVGVGGQVTYQFYRLNPVDLSVHSGAAPDVPGDRDRGHPAGPGGPVRRAGRRRSFRPAPPAQAAALLRVLLGGGPAGPRDRRDSGPAAPPRQPGRDRAAACTPRPPARR